MAKKAATRAPQAKAGVPYIPGVVTVVIRLWNTPNNFRKIADLLEENEMPGPARDIREQVIEALTQMVLEHNAPQP